MEGGLRLFGFGYETKFFQKKVFNKTEYWIENPGFLYRFMPKTQARSPHPVLIPVEKAENTVRIFVLGESAAMGDPEPAFGPDQPQTLAVSLKWHVESPQAKQLRHQKTREFNSKTSELTVIE